MVWFDTQLDYWSLCLIFTDPIHHEVFLARTFQKYLFLKLSTGTKKRLFHLKFRLERLAIWTEMTSDKRTFFPSEKPFIKNTGNEFQLFWMKYVYLHIPLQPSTNYNPTQPNLFWSLSVSVFVSVWVYVCVDNLNMQCEFTEAIKLELALSCFFPAIHKMWK